MVVNYAVVHLVTVDVYGNIFLVSYQKTNTRIIHVLVRMH